MTLEAVDQTRGWTCWAPGMRAWARWRASVRTRAGSPRGAQGGAQAEKTRTWLAPLARLTDRELRTVTLNELLDRYLALVELEESTRKARVGYLDVHVRPMLGALLLSKPNGEVLDTFYRSCVAAACLATGAAGEWTTGRRPSTSATSGVPARLSGAGGVHRASDSLGAMERGALALDRRQPDRQRGCSRRRGQTRRGARSSGSQ